jgi:5'-3' exonuclease
MKHYILIDGSYFVFYRVFALQVWWRNAKPEIKLEEPFNNECFVEKYKSTFISKMNEIKKKLKMKDATIIVGKDCPQSEIWRMKLHPQYKAGRNQEKNKEANISQFFQMTYNEKLFEKAGANKIVEMNHLEADDCLALTAKHLYDMNTEHIITIITSDHDYIQLSNDRIHLINLKYKSLLESKAYMGDPKKDLFYKIILGDKSDNIIAVFDKCGKKTVEKCYNDIEFFSDKLKKENRTDRFELNKKLIHFDLIPKELVDLYYTSILVNL